jgi:hypothetical protein
LITYLSSPWLVNKGHSNLSLLHTEACGYLGALYALWAILKAFPLPRNSPPIYTNIHIDNLGMINRSINTPFSIQQCLLPYWDNFNEALQVCLTIPGTIEVQHIKRHLDSDTNTPKALPLPARPNILANTGTHKYIHTAPPSTKHPLYPPHQWN